MTLWVRLREEVRDRLGPRLNEWEHAFILMVAGAVLSAPLVVLDNVQRQDLWGLTFMILGTIRLISLIINGIRRRVTSWLRALSAVVSSGAFLFISIGYVYAGKIGIVAPIFLILALFEWFNFGRAMRDVGRAS